MTEGTREGDSDAQKPAETALPFNVYSRHERFVDEMALTRHAYSTLAELGLTMIPILHEDDDVARWLGTAETEQAQRHSAPPATRWKVGDIAYCQYNRDLDQWFTLRLVEESPDAGHDWHGHVVNPGTCTWLRPDSPVWVVKGFPLGPVPPEVEVPA